MKIKGKITKQDLLAIEIGTTETFIMPDYDSARSAQSYAGQLKNTKPYPLFATQIGKAVDGTYQRTITIERIH